MVSFKLDKYLTINDVKDWNMAHITFGASGGVEGEYYKIQSKNYEHEFELTKDQGLEFIKLRSLED